MIQGLVWLGASVAALGAVAWIIPRTVVATVAVWRQRNREQPTPPPAAACPLCGGTWGKWSEVIVTSVPNDREYPSLCDSYDMRSQLRTCSECGYADHRVLG